MINDQEKIRWFDLAVKFQIDGMIFLTMKSRKNGIGSWVIEDVDSHKVLNSNMEWEDDLPIDKRDQAFTIRTRFDFDAAASMYEKYKMFAESA